MFGEGVGYSIFDDVALCVHPKAYTMEFLEVLLAHLVVAGDERAAVAYLDCIGVYDDYEKIRRQTRPKRYVR